MFIHLILTFLKFLFPVVSKNWTRFWNSNLMSFWWAIEIAIHVHYEWFNPINWRSNFLTIGLQGYSYEQHNSHPLKKGAHDYMIYIVTLVFYPWNTFTPSIPKHNNFLDKSSLFNHPTFNKTFMMFLMRFLELRMWSIHNPINTHKNWHLGPRINHIHMDTNLGSIVNKSNFITKSSYKMGGLNGLNNGILHLDIHGYNKNPIGWIKLLHVSKLFGTPMLTKSSYKDSYFSIRRPCARTWNKDSIWITFWFSSFYGLITWAKIELKPLWAYNFVFFKWTQFL